MKTIIIDKHNFTTYKEFYSFIYNNLGANTNLEWEDYIDFGFNTNNIYEYLCDYIRKDYYFVMKNFDLDTIKLKKTHEDYRWNIIISMLYDFIEKRPDNKLEFINDKD